MKLRSLLYTLAKLLGDLNAIRRGRVGKRIARRAAGKIGGRWLGKLSGAIILLSLASCDRTRTYDVHHVQGFYPYADRNSEAVLAVRSGEYIETIHCTFPPMPGHLHLGFHDGDDPDAQEVMNGEIKRVEVGERNEQYSYEDYHFCKIVDG